MFTTDKYIAIAYGSARGATLARKVEENWEEWVEEVGRAPWLKNWAYSPYCKDGRTDVRKLAKDLYVNAVWGYGIEEWKVEKAKVDAETRSNMAAITKGIQARKEGAMKCILEMQHLVAASAFRQYTWDEIIFWECGAYVPCEFGTLDRWLEKHWE